MEVRSYSAGRLPTDLIISIPDFCVVYVCAVYTWHYSEHVYECVYGFVCGVCMYVCICNICFT